MPSKMFSRKKEHHHKKKTAKEKKKHSDEKNSTDSMDQQDPQNHVSNQLPSPQAPPLQNSSSSRQPVIQDDTDDDTKHVFISYSRKDTPFAKYLRALLEAEGIKIWMDETALVTGMNWSEEIQRALEMCGALVVIMSPHSEASHFVQSEILHAMDHSKPIFPVLLQGTEPFFLLKAYQTEMMQEGLSAKPSDTFMEKLKVTMGITQEQQAESANGLQFDIVEKDVLKIDCDVLLLKYAGHWYGADKAVKQAFQDEANKRNDSSFALDESVVKNGNALLRCSEGTLGAKNVLIVPTVNYVQFDYTSARQFTEVSLELLLAQGPSVPKEGIVMTMHGAGFGLDETECFLAQLGGLLSTLLKHEPSVGNADGAIESSPFRKITIVEKNPDRCSRLRDIAKAYFESRAMKWDPPSLILESPDASTLSAANARGAVHRSGSTSKKPLALILSTEDADEDVFYYGIQHPVHSMGMLCERMKQNKKNDMQDPAELKEDCKRVRKATVLIIQVSESGLQPWLYCLLGFAWGAEIPTICLLDNNLSNSKTEMALDSECYICYDKIWDLETKLSNWLLESQTKRSESLKDALSSFSRPVPHRRSVSAFVPSTANAPGILDRIGNVPLVPQSFVHTASNKAAATPSLA